MTVAVFSEEIEEEVEIRDSDLDIITTKDSGPGGQHRNKTESCVIMTHKPTKISVKIDGRKQDTNKRTARRIIEAKVRKHYKQLAKNAEDSDRAEQVGSGMRGDKVRTYREKDNRVIDHRTKKKCSLDRVLRGKLDKLL